MNFSTNELKQKILDLQDIHFDELAITIFNYQYQNNTIYRQFVDYLGVHPSKINQIDQIPFLPIQSFKWHIIKSKNWNSSVIFKSSSTTGSGQSQHHLRDVSWYQKIAERCFTDRYGDLSSFEWYGLLPSYLENGDSSLVYMVDHFINRSNNTGGFFLTDFKSLQDKMYRSDPEKIPILIGISYALLDYAKDFSVPGNCWVMETGGMKGRRKEMPKEALHNQLMDQLHVTSIYSEYGMTELLSQSYATSNGKFQQPFTQKILIKDVRDPMCVVEMNQTGLINIIDLANIDTCSFIATDDLGIKLNEKEFMVRGRSDGSEVRGCNLLIDGIL